MSDTVMENKTEPGFGGVLLCVLQGNPGRERSDSPLTSDYGIDCERKAGLSDHRKETVSCGELTGRESERTTRVSLNAEEAEVWRGQWLASL